MLTLRSSSDLDPSVLLLSLFCRRIMGAIEEVSGAASVNRGINRSYLS